MKLEADVNEVVLSNVGASGEFKIRNSAKAFKILSDGLYSNKIKAIIRELSCNAVDSHVGAGCAKLPFEVHLPTMFEPWFSVRDFGLGLDANQVVNIYTTYFESTKTDSNDFIGALGLGSKSPFSYTENFTVTAIKNGTQRIYSAFINDQGVPSIAEMSQSLTDEGNGVEVKFSVTDRSDYNTFANEAREVFKWFEHKPTVTGVDNFQHADLKYKEMNIVSGVHTMNTDHYGRYPSSIALMGNIAYPLNDIPAVEKHLKGLEHLLGCGLVLEFGIGDLDFAASREHLSYIPSTLASIKRKLDELNANLTIHLAKKADAFTNKWKRAFFLQTEYGNALYKAAVNKYVTDTKFELIDLKSYNGRKTFNFSIADLATRQVSVSAFISRNGSSSAIKPNTRQVPGATAGGSTYELQMEIPVEKTVVIVLNDLKTGCISRARYHYNRGGNEVAVYCFSHSSQDLAERDEEYNKIIAGLHNPPVVVKASILEKQIRAKPVSTQGIMTMRLKSGCSAGSEHSYMWEPYTDELDDNITYHYVALSNHTATDQAGDHLNVFAIKAMIDECGVDDIKKITILGVRKNRIKELKELDNWVWFEEILKTETARISDANIASLVVAEMLDSYYNRVYTDSTVAKIVGPDSDYAKYVKTYGGIKRTTGNANSLAKLCEMYGKKVQIGTVKKSIEDTKKALYQKYPLLQLCRDGNDTVTKTQIAEYIMMVDKQEKI